ncbi:MAG TPA: hypothetical protein VGE13_03205 [Candidatus Saccharimonadales bacterium]
MRRNLSPTRFVRRRRDKSIVGDFAERHGLVYFGRVVQSDEEYRIVRGMTLSVNHFDAHYCVGTYEGYDVAFVERTDTLVSRHGKKSHRWHIIEFDLLAAKHLPHIFVGMHSHSESFYMQLFTKYPQLRSITLGALGAHKAEFFQKYRVYASPSHAIDVERILSPLVTEMVSKHFGSLAIEIHDSSLYIYAENHATSTPLLEAMIKNGRWLADHIDRQADAQLRS